MEQSIQLRPPKNPEEWERLHQLRREGLFAPHFPDVTYDINHPDDHHPDHHPLVFVVEGRIVGTVRLDTRNDSRIVVRLVVIDPAEQGEGLGKTLMQEVELYAEKLGGSELLVNSLESVVGFYKKLGFEETEHFDPPAVQALSARQISMKKSIGNELSV